MKFVLQVLTYVSPGYRNTLCNQNKAVMSKIRLDLIAKLGSVMLLHEVQPDIRNR